MDVKGQESYRLWRHIGHRPGHDQATGRAGYRNMTVKNVIRRAGKPEEVAQGIVFLVQNDFVTGTTIDVDGGWLLS